MPPGEPQNYEAVVNIIINLFTSAIPVVASLALLFFLWGLVKFLMSAGDTQAKSEGKTIMFYGIIALFVMLSVWGIVVILGNTIFGGNFESLV